MKQIRRLCLPLLALFLLPAGAPWAGAASPAKPAPGARPNILFILADDLGWRDLGCFGSTFHETPNLDRLAARGARFTQAYAASPLCSPTRASILTGQYPARIGITSPACHVAQVQLEKRLVTGAQPGVKVLNAESLTRLKPDYFTLAEALREAGYATAHFGKWHLGHSGPYEPKDQGFDSDFPHTPSVPGPGGGYLAPWSFIKDPPITDRPGRHIEDRMADEAAAFIRAHADSPFYVNYWAYSVHSPWNARPDYIAHFKEKTDPAGAQRNPLYAAMVKSLDDGVGRLVDAIDAAGIVDRTIVVFFSDNGGYAYPPKATDPEGYADIPATSNAPLRSGKASLYEGGTREPLVFVWPGRITAGATRDALFQSVDFYPTLLALCGLKPRPGLALDGIDQTAALLGTGAPPRDRVFCHFPHGGVRQAAMIPGFLPGTYVRRGDWKLIRFFGDTDDGTDRFELYNLRDDIGESRNLAREKPELTRELDALITGFLRDTEAVIPTRNPHYDMLEGWKARGCDAVPREGVLTVTGKSATPFLGVGAGGITGPSVVRMRARCAASGPGRIEWIPGWTKAKGKGKGKAPGAPAGAAPFTLDGGDWQIVTIDLAARGPLGIVRVHLPAREQVVEIDWIELGTGARRRRWDF